MIDFLVNLALNLRPKTHQKWCQEAFKILKNAIKNVMQVGMAFGTLLERILVDFVSKLGSKLEPSWPILAVLSCLIRPYLTKSWDVATRTPGCGQDTQDNQGKIRQDKVR